MYRYITSLGQVVTLALQTPGHACDNCFKLYNCHVGRYSSTLSQGWVGQWQTQAITAPLLSVRIRFRLVGSCTVSTHVGCTDAKRCSCTTTWPTWWDVLLTNQCGEARQVNRELWLNATDKCTREDFSCITYILSPEVVGRGSSPRELGTLPSLQDKRRQLLFIIIYISGKSKCYSCSSDNSADLFRRLEVHPQLEPYSEL